MSSIEVENAASDHDQVPAESEILICTAECQLVLQLPELATNDWTARN